jgi:uncharacterized protein YggE
MLPIPLLAQAAARVEDDGTQRVVVTATKVARLVPDRVAIFAVIEGSAESATESAQRAERKLQTVNDAVRQLNLRAELVQTSPYGVMPQPNYGGFPQQSATVPMVARYIMRIQVPRTEQLMSVSSALIAAGASSVGAPVFEAAAADSARRAKYSEALTQARADAEALAAALGTRLGALIEVTANAPQNPFGPQNYLNFGRSFEVFSGPGQMPEVQVSATVTVRYRLLAR